MTPPAMVPPRGWEEEEEEGGKPPAEGDQGEGSGSNAGRCREEDDREAGAVVNGKSGSAFSLGREPSAYMERGLRAWSGVVYRIPGEERGAATGSIADASVRPRAAVATAAEEPPNAAEWRPVRTGRCTKDRCPAAGEGDTKEGDVPAYITGERWLWTEGDRRRW